jgi:hypothetical protein
MAITIPYPSGLDLLSSNPSSDEQRDIIIIIIIIEIRNLIWGTGLKHGKIKDLFQYVYEPTRCAKFL